MDNNNIYWVIAATFFGFITLAFLLLYPVYRFIRREEKQSEDWTRDALARRQRTGGTGGDGAPGRPAEKPKDEGGLRRP